MPFLLATVVSRWQGADEFYVIETMSMRRKMSKKKHRRSDARRATLKQKLGESFERIADTDRRVRKQRRKDFVFHMVDWEDDLFRLAEFFRTPGRYGPRETDRILRRFLHHAPEHIVQAARLGEFFVDIFGRAPVISSTGKKLPPLVR